EGVAALIEHIRGVLDRARIDGRHVVSALVEEGVVVEDVLADLLARACGMVVVDLDRTGVDEDVVWLIDGGFVRVHWMLLVAAPKKNKLRMMFVNPLDEMAQAAAKEASNARVQPLVGTLTGLRQAIEKTYSEHTTRIVTTPRSEIPHEITRKIDAPPR